jgi:hypothetical protein
LPSIEESMFSIGLYSPIGESTFGVWIGYILFSLLKAEMKLVSQIGYLDGGTILILIRRQYSYTDTEE